MHSRHLLCQVLLTSPEILLATWFGLTVHCGAAADLDLSRATVVVRSETAPAGEETAASVLVEEVSKRTGLAWPISSVWPKENPVIVIFSGDVSGWPRSMPTPEGRNLPEHCPEGFRLLVEDVGNHRAVVWIKSADSRGALFGVGQFLRSLNWARNSASLQTGLQIATSPVQPIRGHQLGYRETANSYDGWDEKQFDQYIRELALFGANSIEGIPFQDERKSPQMKVPRAGSIGTGRPTELPLG